jgi:hypothetical protein
MELSTANSIRRLKDGIIANEIFQQKFTLIFNGYGVAMKNKSLTIYFFYEGFLSVIPPTL